MGGYGSGRWGWYRAKTTVEDCLHLDARDLMRDMLDWDVRWVGTWYWKQRGERIADVGLEVNTTDRARPWVFLSYKRKSTGEEADYKIELQTTRLHYGGEQWWFTCPADGCGRRVRKLYLPPGGLYFACRHCYDLTYRSCQESHVYDGLFGEIGKGMGLSGGQVARLLRERY